MTKPSNRNLSKKKREERKLGWSSIIALLKNKNHTSITIMHHHLKTKKA
jgi:hypothetical protein